MPDTAERYSDPLMDQVRERRRQLSAACSNDLQKLFEAIKRETLPMQVAFGTHD